MNVFFCYRLNMVVVDKWALDGLTFLHVSSGWFQSVTVLLLHQAYCK